MEKRKVFIQANDSQIIGGYLAKYSIERFFEPSDDISVEIMHVEKIPQFQNFVGSTYLQGSEVWCGWRLEEDITSLYRKGKRASGSVIL